MELYVEALHSSSAGMVVEEGAPLPTTSNPAQEATKRLTVVDVSLPTDIKFFEKFEGLKETRGGCLSEDRGFG